MDFKLLGAQICWPERQAIIFMLKLIYVFIKVSVKGNIHNYLMSRRFLCHLSTFLSWGHITTPSASGALSGGATGKLNSILKPMMRCLPQMDYYSTDWPGLKVYHFHPLCGHPETILWREKCNTTAFRHMAVYYFLSWLGLGKHGFPSTTLNKRLPCAYFSNFYPRVAKLWLSWSCQLTL